MRKLTIAIIAAFIFCDLNAQTFFKKTLGGPNSDRGYSVRQTTDGGYIVAGTKEQGVASPTDVYLIKTDANGNEVWSKTFGGAEGDEVNAVQQTSDGGYILVGWTGSFGAVYNDIYLLKTDANGDTVWTKVYRKGNDSGGISVQQTIDGGYIIAGFTDFNSHYDAYVIKTNAAGDTDWTKTFGGSDDDFAHSVQQTNDGGYIIVGFSASFSANGDDDIYLVKMDANGNISWTKTIGGADDDDGYSVQQTTDGGYIIAGSTQSFGAGEFDAYLVKTNANGDTLWTRTFGKESFDEGFFVQQTTDGGYILTGYVINNPLTSGDFDVYLVKTDANGNATWTKTFDYGTADDYGYSVQQTLDGGFIITGYTEGSGNGNDVILIKTDCKGNHNLWDSANCIVTSAMPELNSTLDFPLIIVRPNPFNDVTTIIIQNTATEKVNQLSLKLFDLPGKQIDVLYQVSLTDSRSEVRIERNGLPEGVYFFHVMNKNKLTGNGKLIIQ